MVSEGLRVGQLGEARKRAALVWTALEENVYFLLCDETV